jgi:hypothetical protein
MKHSILALFCFASLAFAEEEPLLPAPINALLPKIKAGMTSTPKPKTKSAHGQVGPALSDVVWMIGSRSLSLPTRIAKESR